MRVMEFIGLALILVGGFDFCRGTSDPARRALRKAPSPRVRPLGHNCPVVNVLLPPVHSGSDFSTLVLRV